MASAAGLSEVLECSICLNVYTDPVTRSCGHNFCRRCISEALDTQEKSGGYSCPGCRTQFRNRPVLQRNTTLHSIVENFLPMKPYQQYTGVSCSHCLHAQVPAVKSCLLCEASLCENHLRVHNKAPEHVLCDPTTSIKSRKCSIHNRILEYYCTEDSTCVCASCCLIGKHIGHKMDSLDEASEKKKKRLSTHLNKLMASKGGFEKRVQSLGKCRREAQEKADGKTKSATALFKKLRRLLDILESGIVSDISKQVEMELKSYDIKVLKLEGKKKGLYRKMCHIEKLCNMTDPLTILQEPDVGDLCDTEEAIEPLYGGGDLSVTNIFQKLHTISNTLSEVLPYAFMQKSAVISLNEITAGSCLCISNGKKTATFSLHEDCPEKPEKCPKTPENCPKTHDTCPETPENCPETICSKLPEKFKYRPQVVNTERFNSEQHYWEVDVVRSQDWKVGVCYPSMDRKGWSQSVIGNNKQSWCLQKWKNQYSLLHDGNTIQLPANIPMAKVGIYLDFKIGQISFYALSGRFRYLHTFTATFTEPLHAAFYVGEGSIKVGVATRKYEHYLGVK
ncbi:E3 ubiquitin/ISG15 ligase TRIM25-like [Hyperolius riggenbachi]|uniref:E3 ubiquitin/ISG15 ligase TRIM25-like n=1 Tax=Hyperolius riggenbachi TaxID=752182 RepID=UPI0035A3A81C